jgi:ribokinase
LCANGLWFFYIRELLANVDYVAPNETELQRLVSLPTTTDAEVATAAAALQRDAGVPNVLVTVGSGGSMLFSTTSAEPLRQPCFPAPCVVDTTGAGDCFRGAFAAALAGNSGLLSGGPKAGPKDALEVGAAAAAHCVTVRKM